MSSHRHHCKIGMNVTSKHILKFEDAKIVLVELYPCNTINELCTREGWYIQNDANCVNKIIAGRSQKVYRQAKKEVIKSYLKNYQQANKEAIKIYFKKYLQDNKSQLRLARQKLVIQKHNHIND